MLPSDLTPAEPNELKLAEDRIIHWRKAPVDFVRECFGVEPDAWQAKVLNAATSNRRIAMQACKGPGKTCVLAWLIWWFMLNENANIAAAAISGKNLSSNLWKELAFWRDKSPFIKSVFAMTATRIYVPSITDGPLELQRDYERTWFCEARTWSKSADDETVALTLAGLHSKYCMAVLDESGGMPDGLLVAAEGVLANVIEGDGSVGLIVQAGNPSTLSGPLYRAATKERSLWFVMPITGDPDDPDRSPRVSRLWAQEQIKNYGRDHPWVLVNVFGRFPPASFNAMIGPDDIRAAMGRHLNKDQYDFAAKIIGVDVARFGDDECVIWPRQGLWALIPETMRGVRADQGAGKVCSMSSDWDADAVMCDGTGGYGAGWIDFARTIGYTFLDVQFAGKPIDGKFYNKRAEIIWKLCEWIKSGGALPDCEASRMLSEELTETLYTYKGDKICVEEKDQIKIKLGRSPDYSDALACTFAFPVSPKERDPLAGITDNRAYSHATCDYDPLERA